VPDSYRAGREDIGDELQVAFGFAGRDGLPMVLEVRPDVAAAQQSVTTAQTNLTKARNDLEKLKAAIASLKEKRQLHVSGIDPQAVAVYGGVKKQRGTAVARVEQGLCRGCRISLPVTEFQKAKTGNLVRCGSCGRILYLA